MKQFQTSFALLVILVLLTCIAPFPVHAQSVTVTPLVTRVTNAGGCRAVETVIKRRSEALPKLAENQMNKFAAHIARVNEYYTSILLPSGQSVSNYGELMTQITTKKSAVEAAIQKARTTGSSFTCESNPKGTMTAFRIEMQAVIRALKEYKTSVRNLIVAVSTATPESL
jgi:hypothetical protein